MPYFYWIDQYIDAVQQFIATKTILAPLLLLFIEEGGLPLLVPGDAIIAYTGYRISTGHSSVTFWEAFIISQIAVLGGATVLFFLSRRWGQFLLTKLAGFIFLKVEHVQRAEHLFAKYGVFGIIFGRHIPGLRIAITVFAATSGIKYLTFIISTFISTSAWILIFLALGRSIGSHFHQEFQRYIGISFGVIITVTLGTMLLHLIGAYRHRRNRQA